MAVELTDVMWEDGQSNPGGSKNAMYLIPTDRLSAMPALKTNKTSLEDYAVVEGNFTFKNAAEKAIKVYITPETGKLMAEGVGEIDGKSYLNKGAFFHPGAGAKASGLFAYLNNSSFVAVMVTKDGQKRILGEIDDPCKITSLVWDTQDDPAARRGFTGEFQAYNAFGPMIWNGELSEIWTESSSSSSASA